MELNELFPEIRLFSGDCYVADYTNVSDSQRGVEISEEPFEDISCFHLKKHTSANIGYAGINFELYPGFIKGIQNCECMFHAVSDVRRPWTMFLEMKYCDEANIEGYTYKAYSQMKETLDKLAETGAVNPAERRIYFVYSVPEHGNQVPFGAFTRGQNATLDSYEKLGIQLLGNNTMLIATPSYLFEQKKRI